MLYGFALCGPFFGRSVDHNGAGRAGSCTPGSTTGDSKERHLLGCSSQEIGTERRDRDDLGGVSEEAEYRLWREVCGRVRVIYRLHNFDMVTRPHSSAAGVLALLADPEPLLKQHALKSLVPLVPQFWAEISEHIALM